MFVWSFCTTLSLIFIWYTTVNKIIKTRCNTANVDTLLKCSSPMYNFILSILFSRFIFSFSHERVHKSEGYFFLSVFILSLILSIVSLFLSCSIVQKMFKLFRSVKVYGGKMLQIY